MKLGKPPIIQAWIEFQFDHGNDRSEWSLDSAQAFVKQFKDEYSADPEILQQYEVRIEKAENSSQPRVVGEQVTLLGMRVTNLGRSRYLQLTSDTLVCNFLRTDAVGYEGFEALKAEALAKLQAYTVFYRPSRLLRFALHYVDLVRIPFENNRIELHNYFMLGQDLPEAVFGLTLSFLFQYSTQVPASSDVLEVRLRNEPSDPEGPTGQFRMDWRLVATAGLSFVENILGPRIDQAHEKLLDCFKRSFTERAWNLFEPAS